MAGDIRTSLLYTDLLGQAFLALGLLIGLAKTFSEYIAMRDFYLITSFPSLLLRSRVFPYLRLISFILYRHSSPQKASVYNP
jgi:hypothetical protein